jgi:rapamycin-insensitive companion of mTOR
LVSATIAGADLLEDYGWVPTTTTLGLTTGLCVPENINDFATVSHVGSKVSIKTHHIALQLPAWSEPARVYAAHLVNSTDTVESRIVQDVSDLGNFVLATQAMQSLAR